MEPPTYMYYAHIPIIFFLGYTYYIKVGKPYLQNMSNIKKSILEVKLD